MTQHSSHLSELQHAFAAAIRHQQPTALPNIPAERLQVYQRVFFNNVSGFIDNAFPVLTSLYKADAWLALKKRFFAEYRCHSPYFLHISEQFVDFLQSNTLTTSDLPFVAELAHYEWAELYIATLNCDPISPLQPAAQVGSLPIQLSDATMLAAYQYPVQHISANFQPLLPDAPQFFLIYRNLQDEVSFLQLNPASVILLNRLIEQPGDTLRQLVAQIQPQLPSFSTAQLFDYALPLFTELAAKGAIVGYPAAP